MDRQVSQINKSDFRDELDRCHEEGKGTASRYNSISFCPYEGARGQEWRQGWNEQKDIMFPEND